MAKEASGRILLNLDPAIHQQIIDVVDEKDSPYKDMSSFIRIAISEKLDRINDGKDFEILANYEKLNATGKRWLLECSEVAKNSYIYREVKKRSPRSKK